MMHCHCQFAMQMHPYRKSHLLTGIIQSMRTMPASCMLARPIFCCTSAPWHVQASAVDASEERDDALSQLEERDAQIQQLSEQAERSSQLAQQLRAAEDQLGEQQGVAQKLRLELEAQLASRDAQVLSVCDANACALHPSCSFTHMWQYA